MRTSILWPALVLAAAAACSDPDGVGPLDIPLDRPFDFSLPPLRQLSLTPTAEVSVQTDSAMAYSTSPDSLPPGFEEVLARGRLIVQPSESDAGFPTDHEVAFGQALGTSRGSFYRNAVRLTVRYLGDQVAQADGEESASCLCAHPFSPWGDIANVTIGIGGECGHAADAHGRHEARLELTIPFKTIVLLSELSTSSANATQPPCSVRGHSTGAGGWEDGEWYICYWIDIVDHNGDFIRRIDLGCEPWDNRVS